MKMEDDQIFIDKFVKKTIENYKAKPSASWNELEMYMKDKGVVSKTIKGYLNIKNIRTDIAIISGILVITTGVVFFRNETGKELKPKDIIENISDTTTINKTNGSILKIDEAASGKDTLSEKNTKELDVNKNKTVKIKLEVPVHKNVIIKKQVIIKDTLN